MVKTKLGEKPDSLKKRWGDLSKIPTTKKTKTEKQGIVKSDIVKSDAQMQLEKKIDVLEQRLEQLAMEKRLGDLSKMQDVKKPKTKKQDIVKSESQNEIDEMISGANNILQKGGQVRQTH